MSGRFCYSCGRYEARCHCRAPWFDTSKAQAPSLTIDQRAALEAGAVALGLAASYASAGGNQAEYERLLVHARTLRAMAEQVASDAEVDRWVPWKPGDALPAQPYRNYLVTQAPKDSSAPFLWECTAVDFNERTLAYWSRPLPPPYEPPSTAEKGE